MSFSEAIQQKWATDWYLFFHYGWIPLLICGIVLIILRARRY